MATTYTRLRILLDRASRSEAWDTYEELAKEIRGRRLKDFKIRGDGGSIDDYMKAISIIKLLQLLTELGLLQTSTDGRVSVSPSGQRSLESEDRFQLQLRSSVKSLLERRALPMEKIFGAMQSVTLPEVPNVQTIHGRLRDAGHTIREDELRRLLFLYACAGGVDRRMRVYYMPTT